MHELMAVRQGRLAKQHLVRVLELVDRAPQKTLAQRRILGQKDGNRGTIDVAQHARSQRLGAGLVLAADQKRSVADRIARIGQLQQHRVTVAVQPANPDRASGHAVHAFVGFALRKDDLAGTVLPPPACAIEQPARALVAYVPVASSPYMAEEARVPLWSRPSIRHGFYRHYDLELTMILGFGPRLLT